MWGQVRDHRGETAVVRHDADPEKPAAGRVLELRLVFLVDLIGGIRRRDLGEQRVDAGVGQGLLAHLPRLAVLHHGDGLVGEQVQLLGLLT